MTRMLRRQNNNLLYHMVNGKTSTTGALAKRGTGIFVVFLLCRRFSQLYLCFSFFYNGIGIGARQTAKCQDENSHYKSEKFHGCKNTKNISQMPKSEDFKNSILLHSSRILGIYLFCLVYDLTV